MLTKPGQFVNAFSFSVFRKSLWLLYRGFQYEGAGFLVYLFGDTDIGGGGAGFLVYLFGGTDIGGGGAGFLVYLFGGTDIGEPAPCIFTETGFSTVKPVLQAPGSETLPLPIYKHKMHPFGFLM
jgi:hypothetical protein